MGNSDFQRTMELCTFNIARVKWGKKSPTKTDQFTKTTFRQQLYGRKGLVCVTQPIYFVLCFPTDTKAHNREEGTSNSFPSRKQRRSWSQQPEQEQQNCFESHSSYAI